MRLFISYDNATKQLDTVYDITPELAQAFLERINASGFDMSNTSTLYRQVTFFNLNLVVCHLEKRFRKTIQCKTFSNRNLIGSKQYQTARQQYEIKQSVTCSSSKIEQNQGLD